MSRRAPRRDAARRDPVHRHLGRSLRPRRLLAASAALSLVVALGACASGNGHSPVALPSATETGTRTCDTQHLPLVHANRLTVATGDDSPTPYFTAHDPSNGDGYESAVTYALAQNLGFDHDQVAWVTEPLAKAYEPGPKNFDFDIDEIAIAPDHARDVTFSDDYYDAPQVVVARRGTPAATATSVSALRNLDLGAVSDSAALDAITRVLGPAERPKTFDDAVAATKALQQQRVDAIVVDLPTAEELTTATSNGSPAPTTGPTIVGQLAGDGDDSWGLVLAKDSALTGCVNGALYALRENGVLSALQRQWLPPETGPVPTITP